MARDHFEITGHVMATGHLEARHCAKQRALSAAAWTDEHDEVSIGELEIDGSISAEVRLDIGETKDKGRTRDRKNHGERLRRSKASSNDA